MFYCDECAKRNEWPIVEPKYQSYGPCELCGKITGCNDIPSKQLPPQRKKKVPIEYDAAKIKEILADLTEMDNVEITGWLYRPLGLIGGKTPMEAIEEGNGEEVAGLLYTWANGGFY